MRGILLPGDGNHRSVHQPRSVQCPHGMTNTGERVQVDNRRAIAHQRVPGGSCDCDRLLQAQHVFDVRRKTRDETEFRRSWIAEDVADAPPSQKLENSVTDARIRIHSSP